MSVAALPPEVAWSLVGYTLGPRGWPLRTKDRKYARVLDLIRFSSTCRVARELYGDLRFKALMICVAPGQEAHIGIPSRRVVDDFEETYGNLVKAPDAWREDRAVVLAAVHQSGDVLRTVDSSHLTDKEIVLAAIKNEDAKTALLDLSQKIYRLIPEELQLDEEVARAALGKIGERYIPEIVTQGWTAEILFPAQIRDSDLMLDALRGNISLFYASERLIGDREAVIAAVSQTGPINQIYHPNLQFADERLRDDRGVVEAAIRGSDGGFRALQYASDRLRDDRDLAFMAIQLYCPKTAPFSLSSSYRDLSLRLRSDRELFLQVLAKSAACSDNVCRRESGIVELLQSAGPVLQEDRNVVLAAVTKDPMALLSCSDAFRADREIVVAAIAIDGFALCGASAALQADRDIVLAAVRETGLALYFAAEELKDDFEIALAACENQGCVIEFVSQRLKDDGRIRAAAEAEHAALIEKCGGFENLGRHGRTEEERQREIFARDFANGLPFEQWGASAADDVVASNSDADY